MEYQAARSAESLARLRRALALRALLADDMTQREVAAALGVSQPAISQQYSASAVAEADASSLIEAGRSILRALAEQRGFTDLAVFGSVARNDAGPDSDIDLLVRPPAGATITDLRKLGELFASVLGRPVDLVSYGGLRRGIDDDVLREAVLL